MEDTLKKNSAVKARIVFGCEKKNKNKNKI